jgi:hypothetical protein
MPLPCSLTQCNPPNRTYLQRLCFVIAPSTIAFFFPHAFSQDSVAATSTPLLPLLGAKLPSILLLASCISAFVGLSFC